MNANQKKTILVLSHRGKSFLREILESARTSEIQIAILSSSYAPTTQRSFQAASQKAVWAKATSSPNLSATDVELAVKALEANGITVTATFTVWEGYRELAAQMNQKLKAADLTAPQVRALRDKISLRTKLWNLGLGRARAKVLTEKQFKSERRSSTRSPRFIKPRFGIASFGAFKLSPKINWDDIERVQNAMTNDAEYKSFFEEDSSLIIEDFISGTEFSFEVLAGGGNSEVIAIHEKVELEDIDYAVIENACTSPPASLSANQVQAARTWMLQVFRALDLREGCFHVEARFDGRRWEIIEINPRLGGAFIFESTQLVTGFSLIKGALELLTLRSTRERQRYINSVRHVSVGSAQRDGAKRSFFRVYFADPSKQIDQIRRLPISIEPLSSKVFLKAGDKTSSSPREVFLAQCLWSIGKTTSDLERILNESKTYLKVSYQKVAT